MGFNSAFKGLTLSLAKPEKKPEEILKIFKVFISKAYSTLLLTKLCSGDKIEKNEMGGVCSMYGGEER